MQGNKFLTEIKNKIYAEIFQKRHRIGENSFTRERKLTFPMVFSMILKLVTKSLSIECELLEPNASHIAPSKQAFSKARYKIAHTGFQELLDLSVKTHYEDPGYGTWRGYRIIAADGSSLRLPDNEEIESQFGRFKCNDTEGKQPILARVSLFIDLCTSMILSGRLASWGVGEQTLAEEQLSELTHHLRALGQKRFLFVYDRGYPSLKFMGQHRELEVDFLFRIQKGMYKELWKRVEGGETDFDFEIQDKYHSFAHQKVRVVVIHLPNGELEVLITSLFDRTHFSLIDLSKIYQLRWNIEECYKRLKIGTELGNFSGIYLEAVLQEFWAHLVMCNVLSLYICDKQGFWDPDNIPKYRLNFSVLFGIMRTKLFKVIVGKFSSKKFQALFDRAALRAKVKIRPGRSYSRRMAGKPLRYHVFRRVC